MIGPALSSSPALLQLTEAIHSCSDDAAIDKVRAAVSATPSLNVNGLGKDGHCPLYWAVIDGKAATAALLLQLGASVDVMGSNGLAPLHRAASQSDGMLALLLTGEGAKTTTAATAATASSSSSKAAKPSRPSASSTPSTSSAVTPSTSSAVTSSTSSTATPSTPSTAAAVSAPPSITSSGSTRSLHLPPRQRAAVSVNRVDRRYGRTPLHWAACAGVAANVSLLLSLGAAVDARDDVSCGARTARDLATVNGHTAVADMLLQQEKLQAKLNKCLSRVSSEPDAVGATLVRSYAGDVNAADASGRTLLLAAVGACSDGRARVLTLRCLAERHADAGRVDAAGRDALDVVVALLIDACAPGHGVMSQGGGEALRPRSRTGSDASAPQSGAVSGTSAGAGGGGPVSVPPVPPAAAAVAPRPVESVAAPASTAPSTATATSGSAVSRLARAMSSVVLHGHTATHHDSPPVTAATAPPPAPPTASASSTPSTTAAAAVSSTSTTAAASSTSATVAVPSTEAAAGAGAPSGGGGGGGGGPSTSSTPSRDVIVAAASSTLRTLVSRFPTVDVNRHRVLGFTPLHHAASVCAYRAVLALLQCGADATALYYPPHRDRDPGLKSGAVTAGSGAPRGAVATAGGTSASTATDGGKLPLHLALAYTATGDEARSQRLATIALLRRWRLKGDRGHFLRARHALNAGTAVLAPCDSSSPSASLLNAVLGDGRVAGHSTHLRTIAMFLSAGL